MPKEGSILFAHQKFCFKNHEKLVVRLRPLLSFPNTLSPFVVENFCCELIKSSSTMFQRVALILLVAEQIR